MILKSDYEHALFERFLRFNQFLRPFQYENQEALLVSIEESIIRPAEVGLTHLAESSYMA